VTAHILAGAAVFGGLGLSVFLLVLALRGTVPRAAPAPGRAWLWRPVGHRAAMAAGAGLLVLVVTRWPVAAGAVAALVAARSARWCG
jgi:hypothetical protein